MTFFCCLLFLVIWLDNYSISKVLRVFIYLNKQKMNVCNWSNLKLFIHASQHVAFEVPTFLLALCLFFIQINLFHWIKINRCFLYVYFVLYKFIYLLVKKSIVKIWIIWKFEERVDTHVILLPNFCLFFSFTYIRTRTICWLRQRLLPLLNAYLKVKWVSTPCFLSNLTVKIKNKVTR